MLEAGRRLSERPVWCAQHIYIYMYDCTIMYLYILALIFLAIKLDPTDFSIKKRLNS